MIQYPEVQSKIDKRKGVQEQSLELHCGVATMCDRLVNWIRPGALIRFPAGPEIRHLSAER